jgi:hypothetical protein
LGEWDGTTSNEDLFGGVKASRGHKMGNWGNGRPETGPNFDEEKRNKQAFCVLVNKRRQRSPPPDSISLIGPIFCFGREEDGWMDGG